MFKKIPKWLSIPLYVLPISGIFFLYICSSIETIISEQEELANKSETAQTVPAPGISPVRDIERQENIPEIHPGNILVQSSDTSAASPKNETAEAEQWRIIEQSQSYDNQLQYYSPGNVSFDGERIIISSKEEFMGDKRYTSGMVESNKAYLYGRFSFEISVSQGKGLFPAIWLMPAENKALPEIDIFEMIGSAPGEFYGVLHYMDGREQKRDYYKTAVDKKDTYLIELEWRENKLCWFIDGVCMLEIGQFVPNEFMYLIINQAVGGTWPGPPDEDTAFPATFILESWSVTSEWSQPR